MKTLHKNGLVLILCATLFSGLAATEAYARGQQGQRGQAGQQGQQGNDGERRGITDIGNSKGMIMKEEKKNNGAKTLH